MRPISEQLTDARKQRDYYRTEEARAKGAGWETQARWCRRMVEFENGLIEALKVLDTRQKARESN